MEWNGETLTTHNSTFTLELQNGVNSLKVYTDFECQGVYEEKILMSDDFLVYPNPFKNLLNIFNANKGEKVNIKVYSVFGQLVVSKTFDNQGNEMELDTSALTDGMYIISVESKSMSSTHKMIKE